MSNNHRVLNISRGFTLKYKQAVKAVEECASDWTDNTRTSIRDLTLAESIAKRNEQARLRAPLDAPELPGIKVSGITQDFALIRAANQFAHEAAQA